MKSSSIRNKSLALLLMLCMALFALPAFAQEFTVTRTVEFDQALPGTSDELFSAYLEQELYAPIYGDVSMFGTQAGNRLGASQKLMYDALKGVIEEIADGSRTSSAFTLNPSSIAGLKSSFTAADLGVSSLIEGDAISDAAIEAVYAYYFGEAVGTNYEVFNALLHDCPLELYWFNKAGGVFFNTAFNCDGTALTVELFEIAMTVAEDYQGGTQTTVNAADVSAIISKAQSIVSTHASKSDAEKLKAYRDEICALTSYNDDAADASTGTPYGDPWQLIYVFDGDKNTTVVCEGYAKAFQYLCDLSSFKNTECYTVTGVMDAENHMWNVVVMDGVSYMVDVTNSDAGTSGQNGGLFLTNTPAEGSVGSGYLFLAGSQGIHYAYDQDVIDLWGEDILTIGGAAEHVCDFSGKATCSPYYDGDPETQHVITVQCTGCDETLTSIENHTISSAATCNSSAYCEPCNIWFGDYDDTNHESNEVVYVYISRTQHEQQHACCGLSVLNSRESHTESTPANCQSPAYCADCDSSYGSKAPNTHALSTYKYVVNSSNSEKHDKVYDCCGKVAETVAHKYSAATCQAPKTCSECGHTTGDKGDHVMDETGKCTLCGTEAAAKFTDAYNTVTYYADYIDLQKAVHSDHAAGTITLLKDQTSANSTGLLNLSSGHPTTLDLNGKTLALGLVIKNSTSVLIKDSTSGKGTIVNDGGYAISIYDGTLKIDASADCIGKTAGHEAWRIKFDSVLSVGTDVILPEGVVLIDNSDSVVTSIPADTVVTCHQHSFETDWTVGQDTHWHACSGCDAKNAEAQHTFDANGQCTICKATAVASVTIGGETTHLYSFEYIHDFTCGATAEVKLFADYSDEHGAPGVLNVSEGANVTIDMNGNSIQNGACVWGNALLKLTNTASSKGIIDASLDVEAGCKLIIDASVAYKGIGVYADSGSIKVGTEVILPEGYVLIFDDMVVTELPADEFGYLHQHSFETDWTTDETHHWHACEDCDAKQDEATHTGGTANCTDLAECSVCGEAYGSTDADVHAYTYTVTNDTIVETCTNGCAHREEATLLPPTNLAYDGTAKNATIEDKFSGRLDLTITYNTADGKAPVAQGKYTASIKVGDKTASIEFEIGAAALNAEVTLSPETVIYNGSEQKPTVIVAGLTEGKDYTVSFPADMTNAGIKTITITGKGNYEGVASKTFTIEKASLTAADFIFTAPSDLVYNGKTKIASVTTAKTDAAVTVKYSADPVNTGDYTVSIDIAESQNYNAVSGLTDSAWRFTIAPKTVTTPTFSGLETLYLHTGSALEPTFTLKDGETEIPASEYEVAYSNNVNVGTATVTVTDKTGGNYTVSGSATFTIATHEHVWSYTASGNVITATCSGDLGSCPNKTVTLTVNAASAVYDGSAKTASVTVEPAGALAAPAITYSTADGSAPVNAGTYDASITLGSATATTSLTIEKANLTAADFVFTAPANLVYDGNTKIAKVLCTKTDCVITVKYNADPVNVGTYTVSIDVAQSKNYNNASLSSDAWTFTITPASIADAAVTAGDQVYTGEALTPAVTVTLGGKTLTEGTDFTVAYSDNVSVGTAKITVTGKGNYEGTANGTFEIKASGSALTANADKTAYTYGDKITVTAKAAVAEQKRARFSLLRAAAPTMALYYGDAKIAEAEVVDGEATIVYDTADRAFAPADSVALTVRFSGDANMAESETTVSFSLSKKTLSASLEGSVSKVYDGTADVASADGLSFTVSGSLTDDTVTVKASAFAFDNADAGANKTITASGLTLDETSAKFYALDATTASAAVGTITPAFIAGATVTADNDVYTGEALTPAVTVTLGGKTLTEGTDFTVAYSNNVNVGVATITVTGKGNYEGTANGTFEIGKARPVTEAPTGMTAVYGDQLSTVALPDHDLGTWNWVTPDVQVGNAGVQTHEVIFVPFDAEQYISVTLDAKVTVTKADMTFGESFKVLVGDAENTVFTYGDVITVKAKPEIQRTMRFALRSFSAPKANQMALFSGDTQISEAVDPDADGVYTMTYDTSDKALAAGSNTITAKYVGTENLNDFSASAAITIAKRELTITSVKANNRVHKAGNTKVTVTGAEFDGKLAGDDVNIAPVKGDVGSDEIGTYTTVTLPALTLTGNDASFYSLKAAASASTNVEIVAVPENLPVEPELDSFDDTDISDELKDAGFDSIDDVNSALKNELDDQVAKAEAANPTTTPGAQPKEILGTETFNIDIAYNEDGEKIEGDPEHFPQSGLTILLPIPEGTAPDTHEYYGAFMTGNVNGDHTAGKVIPLSVEVVTGENGEQMLRVEIPAMGQVMIGWVAKPVNLPETGDASSLLLWLALLAISCPAMLFTSKKMKRSVR